MRGRGVLGAGALAVAAALLVVSPAAAEPVVGAVGPNVLVRPADAPAVTSSVQLTAAANEFESVQVVVRAGDVPVDGLDVSVSGTLTGPGGASIPVSAFSVYRVGYYVVAGRPSDGELGGALGAFPDSLIPRVDRVWNEPRSAFPVTVPAGQNRLAWVDLLVPAGTPPGRYSGASIRVASAGREPRLLPVVVDVLALELPSTTTLDGGFDLNSNRLCQVHACSAFPGGSAGLAAAYARVALDNRVTIAKPPTSTPSGPADPAYRTWSRPLLLGTAATRLAGARLTTITIYQWARESADEWRRIAEADGLVERVRFHCDEIATSAAAWTRCRDDWTRANTLWRGAAGAGSGAVDLPLQVTTSIDDVQWARANGFADLVDRIAILVPVINRLHPKTQPAFPGRRSAFGDWNAGTTPGGAPRELWSYTSCMSMGCSPASSDLEPLWNGWASYGIDQPAAQARAMGWVSFAYDLAGEYYYETARDLPSAWTSQWSDDGGNHGDGTLFYPGTVARVGGTRETVIESIRLKRIRDGREDHEWLLAATREAGRARVLSVARSAFATAFATDVTQARIDTARAELAAMLTPEGPVADPPREPREPVEPVVPPRVPRAVPTCAGRLATIVGTPGADVLRGTPGTDVIHALGGDDDIRSLGSGDVVCAGPGNDTIDVSRDDATDRVSCGSGRDRVLHDRRDRVVRDCEQQTRTAWRVRTRAVR